MEMSDESNDRKRKYFVAFDYWKADGIHGVASTILESVLPISDWDDILKMSDCIRTFNPDMEKVIILNWRKFEDPE
jgi:hypothetical protein